MKRYFIPVILAAAVALTSCNSNGKQGDGDLSIKKPEMDFQHSDTVAIDALVNEYIAYMADNQFEAASNMLHKVDSDAVRPLNEKELKEFRMFWSNFKIYAAKRKSLVMRSGRNNDVTIMVQIAESGDIDQEMGVTSFHLNPIYQEGQWYLTLLDKKAAGVYDVYDEDDQPINVGVVGQ